MTCREPEEMVEERIDRVLTQYRESPKLLFMIRTYLRLAAEVANQTCDLPDRFDILTAVGDQLTILGKRMGFPRTHCICDQQPVVGFDCPDHYYGRPIVGFGVINEVRPHGFCEGTSGFGEPYDSYWQGCEPPNKDYTLCAPDATWLNCASGIGEITLSDDEVYRRFLLVRRYQMMQYYSLEDLTTAIQIFFGPTALVLAANVGRIVIAPGRDLSAYETTLLQLYPRVLPIALGIEVRFHFGSPLVAGFGHGWGGFCDVPIESPNRTGLTSGFNCGDSPNIGGFCEPWLQDANLVVDDYNELGTDDGDELVTGPLTADSNWLCLEGSPWMCEIDVHPYSC